MKQECCDGSCTCEHVPLIDLSKTKLADLLNGGNAALAHSVQRLVRNLDDPNGVISAFSSFVE